MAGDKKRNKTIVFLHPDLGIGGAERLVVDAAVGLQKRGHRVIIFTSHCDPAHCFDEARDGTLDVRVRGNTLVPTSFLGRFAILCAILRQLHLILHIALFTSELRDLAPDAFFVDQLSAGLPLLKALSPPPVLFYCHFPDLLLVQGRHSSLLKRLYRLPFDALEQWTMAYADAVAVNSDFTRSVVSRTWPRLAAKTPLHVVHPCINVNHPSPPRSGGPGLGLGLGLGRDLDLVQLPPHWRGARILLSINRFERKKNLALALRAFALLPAHLRRDALLVLAGGHDARVAENVAHHGELVRLAERELGLRAATASTLPTALAVDPRAVRVLFVLSAPAALKDLLLRSATLLLYTPPDEHFGIVPLEAMRAGLPVLAADSGGPRETVVEGETGWLRDAGQPEAWKQVMERVLRMAAGGGGGGGDGGSENGEGGEGGREGKEVLREMGRKGQERVKALFAEEQMAERLEQLMEGMKREAPPSMGLVLASLIVAGAVGVASVAMGWYVLGGGKGLAVAWSR